MQKLLAHIKRNKLLYSISAIFLLLIIIAIASFSQPTPQPPQTPASLPTPKPKRVEGQIVIKFKPGVTEEQITEDLAIYQATIVNRIPAINRIIIQVPKDQTDAILERLSKDGLIEIAEPDYLNFNSVNDPMYGDQWHLKNTGQEGGTPGKDINIEAAWTVTKGKGVKVAIVDTGVNLNHPDLAGKIVAQRNIVSNSNDVEDTVGHGTHSAGSIAANTDNGQGIAAVCPECKLIIVKDVNGQNGIPDSSIASGMTWAAAQGAQVISVSQGGEHPLSQEIRDAVNYAINKGAIVVASVANCGGDNYASNGCTTRNPSSYYPAAASGVVSVTATNNKDEKSSFASSGTWIKVAAPGQDIVSTVPTHSYDIQKMLGNGKLNYESFSGTSMAAPVAAGVLALIRSTSYGTTANAAIQRLYATADRIPGTGSLWQYGRINAGKAVGAATITPTVAAGVPSPQCLGAACPTLVPTDEPMQPTNVPIMTNQPIATNPPMATTAPIDVPTEEPGDEEPTTAPGGGQTPGTNRPPGTPNGGLLGLLLNLILAFIRLLLALLGR